MTDERWSRVKALFQAAIERPAAERDAFVAAAAADDDGLRREVESLLASDAAEVSFLDRFPIAAEAVIADSLSVPAAAMSPTLFHPALSPSHRLGSYETVELLGAGAMGEVYRARDTKLNRDVALKVLPPLLALDPSRLARFTREAQVLAALNHSNIAAIYGFEESDGVQALVLELVDGPTLADRIAVGPIPLNEVVTIGSQIADALVAAHEKGIIHRDLKPANIKFDGSGAIKVLDFGLAKVWDGAPDAELSGSPAVTATGERTMLGTPAYMSPEQARGRALDKRTDVWSFGCVLFEMLTGRPAFAAETISDTLARVLEGEADWEALPASTPVRLRDLVRRCLQKDANRRLRDIGDARIELDEALPAHAVRTGEPGPSTSPAKATRARTVSIVLTVAAGLGVAGAAAVLWRSAYLPDKTTPLAATHTQVTFIGNVPDAALSPDGRTFAYVSDEGDDRRLMVRDVSGGPALEVSHGPVFYPRWSPDGSRLAYSSTGLFVVSRLGGQARFVGSGGVSSWSPDGSRIAVASPTEEGFRVVTLAGGETRRVALNGIRQLDDLDWDRRSDRLVIAAPDDRQIQWSIWTVNLDGTALRRIHSDKAPLSSPRWSPGGDTIYFLRRRDSAELLSIPAAGERAAAHVLLSGLQAGGRLTLSSDGERLLHTRQLDYSNLWIAGLTGDDPVPRPITHGTSKYWFPQVSPDGRWIVTATGVGTRDTIAKLPLAGGDLTPLTFGDLQGDNSPAWSSDGKRIIFASDRGGELGIWIMDSDGREQRRLETGEVSTNLLTTWTPAGHVAWQQSTPRNNLNYRTRDLTTGREEFLVKEGSAGSVFRPVFSPRNDRVAVFWSRPDRPGLWVLTWPGRDEHFLKERARPLGWSPDGLWIYAHPSGGRQILRVSARTGSSQVVTAFPAGRILSGDVTPDGRHVVCSLSEYKSDAWLIENFDPRVRPKTR